MTNKATTASKKFTTSQDVMNKQIAKVHGGLERIKAALKVTAAYTIAGTLVVALANAFKQAAGEIVEYDQALRNLQAISGETQETIRAMDKTITELASSTKFSVTEVANGMVLLTQAGLSAAEAIQVIGSVTSLAAGTLSNFSTISALLIKEILKLF